MLEAMIHVLRTGCPWRDLPAHFGPWSSVYTRGRRWCQALLWPQILDVLAAQAHGTLECLDATHIKGHQDASSPAGGQENQAIGRTKGGLNTKLTARVDARGRALQVTLAPGQRADGIAAEEQVFAKGQCVVGDKGYDSDKFREHITAAGGSVCIPARSGRRHPAAHHRGHYRRRHRVENLFQRIKRHRRIGTRYDKTDFHFMSFVCLAAVLDWLT
jgi:transposase